MAIGQRIKFFRNRKGMTQKQLGEQLGFKGKTSDVRMAQYESEARVPKIDLVKQMSQIFDVNTHALTVPDIDTHCCRYPLQSCTPDCLRACKHIGIPDARTHCTSVRTQFLFPYLIFRPSHIQSGDFSL